MGKKLSESTEGKENISPKIHRKISLKRLQSNSTTTSTDIIESSVIEHENKSYKNSQMGIENVRISETKSIISLSETKAKNLKTEKEKKLNSLHDTLRNSIRKAYGLNDNTDFVENNLQYTSPLKTPCSNKNKSTSDLLLNKIISSLKKTPESSYLSKSKLRNIQQWLYENDVETVKTPPFANLSVTPRSSAKLMKKRVTTEPKGKKNKREDNSIDSEVEDVLKAVYGEDWKRKNVNDKCKTEPKKKVKKLFVPSTEVKTKKFDGLRSVRRNILDFKKSSLSVSDNEVIDLNSSTLSGVKVMNSDDSNCSENFIKSKKLTYLNNNKRKSDLDISDPELLPSAVKKGKSGSTFSTKKPVQSKTPKKTFLASLSVSTPNSKCHPDAQYFKINFKSKKEELVKKLYKLYNSEIFEGKLADDMSFSWNVKLRGTAGYCYNKRITKSTGEIIRLSRIEFSTKIIDRADRLRDTMIHELCHAASWVIDGVLDGHGLVWNRWASKAMKRFPELPPIKRCHNYDIVSKYVYRCTGCGYSIKRHSKSINIDRKRCGHCFGVLELLLNKKKKGKGEAPEFDTTRTLRTPNKFALFVKENYHSVKSIKTNAKHAEIMKTLSEQYALVKNGTRSGKKSIPE